MAAKFLTRKNRPIFLGFLLLNIYYEKNAHCDSFTNHLLYTEQPTKVVPWFTGPLLAPSANTIPPKHVNVEPYIYFTAFTASYNDQWKKVSHPNLYSFLSQTFIQVGINSFMNFQIVPQLLYQFTEGVRSTQAGDLPLSVDFQLAHDLPNQWHPSVKFTLKTSCPFGKYQNLDPDKLGTDGVGTGSWNPGVGLDFSKLISLPSNRFLALRLALSCTFFNSVAVKGLNVYGGALDTKGTAYPGASFSCDVAMEYTLSQNWTLAADLFYSHTNKIKFSGNPGTLATVGKPSSEQISLAPAIEYNWNINVGIITGVWFTVAGRNSSCFTASVTALNIYF
ncbi:MAG: hypothetical protein V4489_10075 [Chlamydiota bacterium]